MYKSMTCSNFLSHHILTTASRSSEQCIQAARTAASIPDFYRRRLTVVFSSPSPVATPEGAPGSESVECDSLCLPQSLGPSPHRRAGNAIPIPKAAPYLSFGRQSKNRGNAGTARSWLAALVRKCSRRRPRRRLTCTSSAGDDARSIMMQL